MLIPQRGEIWSYDLRKLYSRGHYNHRIEHWLICEVDIAEELMPDNQKGWYSTKDIAIVYVCLETGKRDTKIFNQREHNIDFTGNPFYKRVA